MMYENLKARINKQLNRIKDEKVKNLIYDTFFDTLDNCIIETNGYIYLKTGDIDAMWLRDSVCQVIQYIPYLDDIEIRVLIKKLLFTQYHLIQIDPYANAFLLDESRVSKWSNDKTDYKHNLVWERKFELDSLTYPLYLTYLYFQKTNDKTIFNDAFFTTFNIILKTIKSEQNHFTSNYFFKRRGKEYINLKKDSKPSIDNTLVWSGFRSSDDICTYHYNIPENIFLVATLDKLNKIFKELDFALSLDALINSIQLGIEKYGIKNNMYVYETNKENKYLFIDDANFPSLLSIPFFDYPFVDNNIYQNTRNFILSKKNRYYYQGKILSGIGSAHTSRNMVWPLSLIIQALTTTNKLEKTQLIQTLITSTNNLIHESVHKNNIKKYTREHFGWANSFFSYLALNNIELLLEIYG